MDEIERDYGDVEIVHAPVSPPAAVASPRLRFLPPLQDVRPTAQSVIPGVYAWAVTVVPVAWGRGAPRMSRVAAIAGLLTLLSAPVLARRWPQLARIVSVWGLTVCSGLAWVAAAQGWPAGHTDPAFAFAGLLGWAAFAFVCAAPAKGRDAVVEQRIVAVAGPRMPPRLFTADGWLVVFGCAVAAGPQSVGWRGTRVPERMLLVRLAAIVGGLAIIGATTRVALVVDTSLSSVEQRRLWRGAAPALMALVLLVVAGVMLRNAA